MKHKKQVISFCIIVLIIGVISLCMFAFANKGSEDKIPLINGVLDLKDWHDQDHKVIPLTGSWEFYWNRFVTFADLQNGTEPDLFHNMPEVWNRYEVNGKSLPGFGYGTYRLKVTGAIKGKPLSLSIPTFSTAYRLYINEKLLASNGTVSKDKTGSKPEYKPKQVVFTPTDEDFDIIIQVSNFTYARGGMWYTLYLGTPEKIMSMKENILCRDLFFLGSFFVMAFAYISIFLLRRQEKGHLYFAILCVLSAIRMLLHGSYFINTIFPFIGFWGIIRLDYYVMYWFPVILGLLLREMFKEEISKKPLMIFIMYALFMTILTTLTPISFFTRFVYVAELGMFLIALYLFVKMLVAIWRRRTNSVIIFVGCVIILAAVTYDTMFQNSMIAGGLCELTPVGFFMILILEAFVLARSFTKAIHKKEEVLAELIDSLERERKSELKFFKSQIRPHFIYNSLNTIISISRKDLPRSQKLLIQFSNYLRGFFDFKTLDDMVPIESEVEFIRSYVTLEQARFCEKLHEECSLC